MSDPSPTFGPQSEIRNPKSEISPGSDQIPHSAFPIPHSSSPHPPSPWRAHLAKFLHEEAANSLTHGLVIPLAVAGLVVLIVFAAMQGNPWRTVTVTIYGITLVLMYLASTVYHSFRGTRVRPVVEFFDHAAIYLLIAGTYTPFTLVVLGGGLGWTLFGIVWGLALMGILLRLFVRMGSGILSTSIYIAMGWLAMFAIGPLLEVLPPGGFAWILAGGLAYTGGIIFYAWDRLPYNHALWHLAVIAGTAFHFVAVLRYV